MASHIGQANHHQQDETGVESALLIQFVNLDVCRDVLRIGVNMHMPTINYEVAMDLCNRQTTRIETDSIMATISGPNSDGSSFERAPSTVRRNRCSTRAEELLDLLLRPPGAHPGATIPQGECRAPSVPQLLLPHANPTSPSNRS